MKTYRIDYFSSVRDLVQLRREYRQFESMAAARAYAAQQGFPAYEVMEVA